MQEAREYRELASGGGKGVTGRQKQIESEFAYKAYNGVKASGLLRGCIVLDKIAKGF